VDRVLGADDEDGKSQDKRRQSVERYRFAHTFE
jgi:hypothetical protein